MNTMKTTLSALAILAIAGPAFAADFATLDVNTDGQVSFDEYKAVALTEGKTVTLAAQEFTRMSQGDAVLTQDEFFLAEALVGQPYAFQPDLTNQPLALEATSTDFEPMEFVETRETFPDSTEMMQPPVVIEDVPVVEEIKDISAPAIMEKAMDVDSAVADGVETSIEIPPGGLAEKIWEEDTPIEEIEPELSGTNPELELETLDDASESESEAFEPEDIETGEIY